MSSTSNFFTHQNHTSSLRGQAIKAFDEILSKAQELVKATSSAGEEQVEDLRKGIQRQLKMAKEQLSDFEESVKESAHTADVYVHRNPWPLIGAAAGVGVLVGALAMRK